MRDQLRRWIYRGARPHGLARFLNEVTRRMTAAGLAPGRMSTLEVRGRRSGRLRSFPVVVADYEGDRYLVAMLGERANWVANVRATGGRAALHRHGLERIQLEEVDPSRRAAILRRYLGLAPGARAQFPVTPDAPLADFERISSQYPVFRVLPDATRENSGTRG
jgi:deazaflavin-dependent oxidoreductase (nitroreductase family)